MPDATVTDAATAAEAAETAKLRGLANENLAADRAKAASRWDETRREVSKSLVHGVDYWSLQALTEAQALADLWAEVEQTRTLGEMDWVAAAKQVAADIQRQSLLRVAHGSRSSSALSDALDDVDRSARAKWLTGMTMSWVLGVTQD